MCVSYRLKLPRLKWWRELRSKEERKPREIVTSTCQSIEIEMIRLRNPFDGKRALSYQSPIRVGGRSGVDRGEVMM